MCFWEEVIKKFFGSLKKCPRYCGGDLGAYELLFSKGNQPLKVTDAPPLLFSFVNGRHGRCPTTHLGMLTLGPPQWTCPRLGVKRTDLCNFSRVTLVTYRVHDDEVDVGLGGAADLVHVRVVVVVVLHDDGLTPVQRVRH